MKSKGKYWECLDPGRYVPTMFLLCCVDFSFRVPIIRVPLSSAGRPRLRGVKVQGLGFVGFVLQAGV